MAATTAVPLWFIPYTFGLEVLFLLITVLVAVFAFRTYRMVQSRLVLGLGIGFSLLALSHLLRSVFEGLSMGNVLYCSTGFFSHCSLLNMTAWAHMILSVAAFGTIAYVTLRPERFEPIALFIGLSIIPLFIGTSQTTAFLIVTTLQLAYLAFFFTANSLSKPGPARLAATGFSLLFLGSVSFVVSLFIPFFAFIAVALELGGYLSVLANYLMVMRG